MARVFDLRAEVFDRTVRPCCPPDSVRGKKLTLRFHARGVIDAWVRREIAKARPKPSTNGNGTTDREAYERERAKLRAKREHELELGRLVPHEDIERSCNLAAQFLRGASDTLRRRFGQAAYDILRDAQRRWDAAMRATLKGDE